MAKDADADAKYPNLVQVSPPENVDANSSQVYVNSVTVIEHKEDKALLISGNFANSCTSLKKVTHSVEGHTLTITLSGWMPADKLCAMVLTPYSFIFDDFGSASVTDLNKVIVNGKKFDLG